MLKGERVTRKRKKRKTEGISSSPSSTTKVTWSSVLSAFLLLYAPLTNMLVSPRATFIGTLLVAVVVSVLFLISTTWRSRYALTLISSPGGSLEQNLLSTLNVASRIYVINLPRNTHRRMDMEQLRFTFGLDFTYVDATEGDGNTTRIIMERVAALRAQESSHETDLPPTAFERPQDLDALVESESPLDNKGSDLWLSGGIDHSDPPPHGPLTCAYGDSTLEPYSSQTPPYRLLTQERLACWHSHWRVIRLIADSQDDVSLVLEDDVDMELDIRQRLLGVWGSLPHTWDIVFLGNTVTSCFSQRATYSHAGHCWSEESKRAPIAVYSSSISSMGLPVTTLHPSTSPKCTHAYALSRRGARRLAVYLRHPTFAYSRAIDQAISWLVESGKLRSYSIVPSIVVQRKVDDSNISGGRGSNWRDNLTRGVFA